VRIASDTEWRSRRDVTPVNHLSHQTSIIRHVE